MAAPMDTTPTRAASWRARSSAWLVRWRPILPLLGAELAVWLGFGALLPVMPLYFEDRGVDLATLGLIVAAWPAARLVAEPLFGWLADRTARLPLMLAGLLVTAVAIPMPLLVSGPLAFLVLRAIAGLGAAAYDPAARGLIVDATPPSRRGEAFGLYAAAQFGGFLLGPGLGGVMAAVTGDVASVFILCSIAILVGTVAVALWVREPGRAPHAGRVGVPPSPGVAGLPGDEPIVSTRAAADLASPATRSIPSPARLLNPLLGAAIALQVGSFFSGGTYETVWSLYLDHLGAGLGFIGLTFAIFGLPVPILSPFAGRWVDRRGPLPFLVVGSITPAVAGVLYTVIAEPVWFIPIGLAEGAAFALLSPALYALAAAGSPAGRASTAQGLMGAAGTLGTVIASVAAGYLAATDLRLPFWTFSAVMVACLVLALAIGGRAMLALAPGPRQPPVGAEA
jgi:MFS family permease